MTDHELRLKSVRYRRDVLRYIFHAGAGHTGGSLSCIDILNVLYNRVLRVTPQTFASPNRDRYIQSKGHSVEALYVVLADCGFFPAAELETLCRYQSRFVGHPTRKVPGIEMNTGALGHGLSISVGLALAAKRDAASCYRVFTLLGDGELAEGSNWEAAMAAAHYRLDNLTAILDHNSLQITGRTRDVCCNEPVDEKFRAFGWAVRTVDGHDIGELTSALSTVTEAGRPTCVIANTVKGRGVSFMENAVKWHHGVPSESEYEQAQVELQTAESKLENSTL
jgi:transketolase